MSLRVIKFSAEWCGPCRAMDSVWKDLVFQIKGVNFEVCDVDANPSLASQFRIMSVPTILIIKDGQVVDTLLGINNLGIVKTAVEKYL